VPPLLSIVIPVRNDAESLARLFAQLHGSAEVEIVVSAADETDPGLRALARQRSDVTWVHGSAGRATQLNAGAAKATGDWLWFVHADSVLPENWFDAFRQLDHRAGQQSTTDVVGGSFRFALDSAAWQARLIERCVAGRVRWLDLPYGDQGIFVRRRVFTSMDGFRPIPLLEDVELIGRLKRLGRLRHLNLRLTTSARRWQRDGWWRRSAGNLAILALYWLGVSPERLARRYYREG
jgi:rSAM/selenodomain-associated transferase 2